MTDEQKPFEPTKKPDFGEIQIRPSGSAPRTRSPQSPKQKATAVAPKPPEKAAQRKKTPRSGGRRWGRLCLILLLAAPLLFLLCLAGGLYLLPRYIKGSLAEELGRQLDRPVTIGQASLSPLHLDLHLGEITIGAATAHPEEQELARIADLDARIRPAGLLHGQVILDDVRIDRLRANLLRRTDGSFNVLPPQGSLLNALPNWLQIHGLRLHRSTVHFFDQPSDKKHLVEHIEFTLPAAGQGAEPSLSAV
ncbi:AsmA family protein, partial [Desulfobulbus sp. F5]|nr:AsmA family protein [Desulfobulbus sp. F5]